MNDFTKCDICVYKKEYDWSICFCNDYDSFKPNKEKIIELAKEYGISVSDVIALCNI